MIGKKMSPIMVVSHERSGTHFLMNALAAEFGYSSEPHLAFDRPIVDINFFRPPTLDKYFKETRGRKPKLIRKSHHQFDFFRPVISSVASNIQIFYIYRDPRAVSHSFRHFLNSWDWFEGPKVETAGDFIRAAPAGAMLRYQYHQLPNMLRRWSTHVEGWLAAAELCPDVTLVQYEKLNDSYDEVIDAIAKRMGWNRQRGTRPEMDQNTVLRSQQQSPSNRYTDEDLAFFRQEIGPTMEFLGYEI